MEAKQRILKEHFRVVQTLNFELWQLTDLWAASVSNRPPMESFAMSVSRENLLGQTMLQLKQSFPGGGDPFKLPIKVRFQNEPGQDMGGLRREYFSLLLKELFTEAFGMFRYNEDVRLYWIHGHADYFDSVSAERKQQLISYFELFGNIVGLALYNHTLIDFPLPLFFFKLKFLGV